MNVSHGELSETLLGCLSTADRLPGTQSLSALSDSDWHRLLDYASMQRIVPLLWHRIRQKNLQGLVPEEALTLLRESTRKNTLRNLMLNGEMRLLLAELEKEAIPMIGLKGIVMANAVYENPGLREMNDIDVMVRPEHLERTAAILGDLGYRPMHDYSVDLVLKNALHLPRFVKKNGAQIEIHWNIIKPNTPQSIDPDELWARAVPVRIAGHDALMLSAVDMLLHLCVHTSYMHRFVFGLRPFCDVAAFIEKAEWPVDWDVLLNRAVSLRWDKGVYLALLLARDLAGAKIPQDLLSTMKPSDMSDTIFRMARSQILTDKQMANHVPVAFASILEASLVEKTRIFIQRLFLGRERIALMYGVSPESPKIYLCYVRRLFDMVRRHKDMLKRYQAGETEVLSLVDRTNTIAEWMG